MNNNIDAIDVFNYIHMNLLFEHNNTETRKKLENAFNGLVRCDDELNTPDVIDRNELHYEFDGYIYEYGKHKPITFSRKVGE